MAIDGTARPEDPATEEAEVALLAASDFIHYKDKDNNKRRLGATMPFLLYWARTARTCSTRSACGTARISPPRPSVDKSGTVQCRFVTAVGDIDNHTIKNAEFEYRVGPSGPWARPTQRKDGDHYIARSDASNNIMRKIINWEIYREQIPFSVRFDISGVGDSWISGNESRDSIRMRDSSGDRGRLVAVRYGITWDDPFGSRTTFTSRSWNNDLSKG